MGKNFPARKYFPSTHSGSRRDLQAYTLEEGATMIDREDELRRRAAAQAAGTAAGIFIGVALALLLVALMTWASLAVFEAAVGMLT